MTPDADAGYVNFLLDEVPNAVRAALPGTDVGPARADQGHARPDGPVPPAPTHPTGDGVARPPDLSGTPHAPMMGRGREPTLPAGSSAYGARHAAARARARPRCPRARRALGAPPVAFLARARRGGDRRRARPGRERGGPAAPRRPPVPRLDGAAGGRGVPGAPRARDARRGARRTERRVRARDAGRTAHRLGLRRVVGDRPRAARGEAPAPRAVDPARPAARHPRLGGPVAAGGPPDGSRCSTPSARRCSGC